MRTILAAIAAFGVACAGAQSLTWEPPEGYTPWRYTIYRYIGAGTNTVDRYWDIPNINHWTDTTTQIGVTYTYVVTAWHTNQVGDETIKTESPPSNAVSLKRQPGPPKMLRFVGSGHIQIIIDK